MTSSISWIDRDVFEATLARFGVRVRRSQPPVERAPARELDTGELEPLAFDPPTVEEDPPDEDDERVEPVEREPVERLERAESEHERIIPEFLPPEGALRQRLEAFLTWLLHRSGARTAFVVDRDGLPLVGGHADPDLLAIAASVMRLVDSVNSKLLFPVGRAVNLELEEQQLILISVETPIGKYIVGQVGDRPPDRELRQVISNALRLTFQPSLESHEAAPL